MSDVFPWERIIPKGRMTMLWGAPGAGKSTLTNYYEMEVMKGGGGVLHIEQDEGPTEIVKRMAIMNDWVGLPKGTGRELLKLYGDMTLFMDTDEGKEKLREKLLLHRPKLVVITPVGMMLKGDGNMQKTVAAFFNNLKPLIREFGLTVVLHGHLNKKGMPEGSQYWSNFVDMSWLMEKMPDMVEDRPHRMVVTRIKNRIDAPMGFEWELGKPSYNIRFRGVKRDTLTVEEREQVRAVLEFVTDKLRENRRIASAIQNGSMGKPKNGEMPKPWVTVKDFIEVHEKLMGGRNGAYEAFRIAKSMGVIGQLTNGPKGVMRYYPSERTMRWLNENKQDDLPEVVPPAKVTVEAQVRNQRKQQFGWGGLKEPEIKTEDEMVEEVWQQRSDEEQDEWLVSALDQNDEPAWVNDPRHEEEHEREMRRLEEQFGG